MVTSGRVVGGAYVDGTVSVATIGSGIVVQSGFKRRKLDFEHVSQWQEVVMGQQVNAASAVSQAVVGAVLPRFISKSASAAVAATFDTTTRPPHTVRIDWADGQQSLLKLPDKLFTHFELILGELRSPDTAIVPNVTATEVVTSDTGEPPTLTEQAFSLVSGLIKDRKQDGTNQAIDPSQIDVADQLSKLASLRDAGILTEEEFTAKKTELLARM
ncbi:putative oligomerization/nucleic acid binding protein [Frondihabitans sp. PhB188]|uniref:SHOCT domain-containing protein n=1 Tax=Frondihabitans sp. PhB188 TaxID=2485200 RepID=UPI000FAC3183|nr:SHOCT domain-containing protein [Frondihabitans sp. PhB188]ROQ40694.1 putative oligomerization/nucleic acid binding protein [Frondihabitans sp. PhB188]